MSRHRTVGFRVEFEPKDIFVEKQKSLVDNRMAGVVFKGSQSVGSLEMEKSGSRWAQKLVGFRIRF